MAKKILMSEYHARLGATLMFAGFPIPERARTIGPWLLKELKTWSMKELNILNHELHVAIYDKKTKGVHRDMYKVVVSRINTIKLRRYDEEVSNEKKQSSSKV